MSHLLRVALTRGTLESVSLDAPLSASVSDMERPNHLYKRGRDFLRAISSPGFADRPERRAGNVSRLMGSLGPVVVVFKAGH